MQKQQKKSATSPAPVNWSYETHELPGRTVTIAELVVPSKNGRGTVRRRGVSIRNPHDCPLPSDGIKVALTRALQNAQLSKARRRLVWQDFLTRFPARTAD